MELTAGYKVTDAGVIPDGWSVGTFGEVCRVNQGLQVAIEKRLKYRTKIAKIYITIQFLNDRKSIEYIETYPLSACCSYDDVLMTRTGNTGIVVSGVEGVFHNNFFKINFNKKILVREYLISFLCLGSTRKTILMKAGTSTIPDLNHSDFYSIPLPIPPVSEQRKIAIALADVDSLIAGLEKLIAKKRDIKQAAMQQLLTGQTRLPGFSEDWVVKSLGDIANIKTGSRNNENKVEDGLYPFFVRSAHVERINTYSHECEGILVPGEGQIGNIFHYINGRFDVHQRVYAITQFIEDVSGKYIHLYMSQHFGEWAMQNTVKATVDSLRLPTFQTFQVKLPPTLEEQTAIARALSDMDGELIALESRLAKTRDLKQGMMQELLTGRIRLV